MLRDIRETLLREGRVVFPVKVIPRSSRSELLERMPDGALKVKLAAVPEKGKANEELLRLLAQSFAVSRSQVELVSGENAQRKRVRIRLHRA